MKYLCLLMVMMTTVALMAAEPVGRVTCSGPLTLNGKAVPATAASSLPVVAGDEIATSGTSAIINFADRSRGTLEANSRVKLEARSSSVALRVLSGSADLTPAAGSRISLIPLVRPVERNSSSGPAMAQPGTPLDRGGNPPRPPSPRRPPTPPPPPPPPPRSPHCPPDHPHCE